MFVARCCFILLLLTCSGNFRPTMPSSKLPKHKLKFALSSQFSLSQRQKTERLKTKERSCSTFGNPPQIYCTKTNNRKLGQRFFNCHLHSAFPLTALKSIFAAAAESTNFKVVLPTMRKDVTKRQKKKTKNKTNS